METSKKAFTLAEVLITLGIIGVVAAMTIPTLVGKYKDKELTTRAKKTYNVIGNALQLAQVAYGTPGDNSSLFSSGKSSVEVTKEMAKYFNGAKYCDSGANAKGCKHLNYKIKYAQPLQTSSSGNNAAMTDMTGYSRIILNDGTVIGISTKANNCEPYIASGAIYNSDGTLKKDADGNVVRWESIRSECGTIVFDTNGYKEPNQFGRDAFSIIVNKGGLGTGYWGATGTTSLNNILMGKNMSYVNYSSNDVFEW